MENGLYPSQPQGTIIEEKRMGPQIKFNINPPSLFTNHPVFLTTIGSISFLGIIFAISYNILIHSINIEELIAAEIATNSTGAILGEKTPEQADIDQLAEDLIQLSPLSTRSYTLTFDYKKNAFIISPKNNDPNYRNDFIDWLNNSDYRILPSSYFTFK